MWTGKSLIATKDREVLNRRRIVMENNENIGASTPEAENTQAPEKDYKHEYEKQLMEIEKLKNAISKTNSENAEYKRKELEKMTDDEKKAKEYQDLIESNQKLEARLREIETQNSLIGAGFTKEESAELLKANFSMSDVNVLANIIKAKVELAEKSAKAEMIKDTTPSSPMGNSNGKSQELSYAERLAKQNAVETSASDKIKNIYK